MPFVPADSSDPAAWLLERGLTLDPSLGPRGFKAYVRVRFVPDPLEEWSREEHAADPVSDLDELDQAIRAVLALTTSSETDQLFACLWDGLDEYDPDRLSHPRPPRVDLPLRSYSLMTGTAADVASWRDQFGDAGAPALLWPADRSWCFSKDVDPVWAGIAGSPDAIDRVLALDDLDVVHADPDVRQPHYRV